MADNKTKKPLDKKKLLKVLIPVIIVVIIAAALVVVLNLPDSTSTTEVESTESAKIDTNVDDDNVHNAQPATNAEGEMEQNGDGELLSYVPKNINTIKIENSGGSYTIKSYTPVEKTTDSDGNETEETDTTQYTLVGFENVEMQSGQPDAIANDVAALSFTKVVSVDGKDSSDFGFDEPQATATVTYDDKTTAKIIVGANAPTNAGVYIKFGSNDTIYLVESDAVDSLLYTINDLISKTVTDSADDGDNASATKMVLSGTLYKDKVTIVQSDDETASTNYLITTPDNYYGADSTCSEIEAGIRGVYADSVVCVNPSKKQLKKYGLATPYAEINATYPDTTVKLIASKPNSKGYCYLMVKGGNVVYKILSDSIRWTEMTLDDLRSTYFVDNVYSYVSGIDVTFGKNKYSFSVKSTTSTTTDDDGNDQTTTTTTAKCNGSEISSGSLQTAFDMLHSDSFERKEFTSEKISGSPVMTIKFTYTEGRSSDTIKFYDLGKQKIYVTVNDEEVSYVYKTAMKSLQKQFTSASKSSPDDEE
jgi:hypothetical protein